MFVVWQQCGQWAGVFLSVQACKEVCTPHARFRLRACRRSRGGIHTILPFSATPLAKRSVMPTTFPARAVRTSSWLQSRRRNAGGRHCQYSRARGGEVRGVAVVVRGPDMKDLRITGKQRTAAEVFAVEASPLADATRSCGLRSGQPGTDAQIQPQSVSGLRQTPKADLLPPVSLVALNLLLGHA